MSVTLEETKKYLRISYDNDDDFITELIKTAEQLVKEQTGVSYADGDGIYKTAILQIVAHFYDKRESYSEKSITTVPYTMNGLIQHIGIRGDYKDE